MDEGKLSVPLNGQSAISAEYPSNNCCLLQVGMDSDVWKSELSVFVSAKNVNMDIRIRIRF
jgi:hypothetical protein